MKASQTPTRKEQVIEYLQKQTWGTMAVTRIATDLNIPYNRLTSIMSELHQEGKVTRFWHGKQKLYSIVKPTV